MGQPQLGVWTQPQAKKCEKDDDCEKVKGCEMRCLHNGTCFPVDVLCVSADTGDGAQPAPPSHPTIAAAQDEAERTGKCVRVIDPWTGWSREVCPPPPKVKSRWERDEPMQPGGFIQAMPGGGMAAGACSYEDVVERGCETDIDQNGNVTCKCPPTGQVAWGGVAPTGAAANQCEAACDSQYGGGWDFMDWQECRNRCQGVTARPGGAQQAQVAAPAQVATVAAPAQASVATLAMRRRRGLTRKGMGARSYANRAFGDQMSVDVQHVGQGHWRATVNANGGYAQKVFGNHFQAEVQGGNGSYRGSVSTRKNGLTLKKGVGGRRGAGAARRKLPECGPGEVVRRRCDYYCAPDIPSVPQPPATPPPIMPGWGIRGHAGIGEQHGSYGNWVGTMDLASPYYMRGRRAVWAG
jgi:hypothetical protein